MNDEQLLRNVNLILTDTNTGKEGITTNLLDSYDRLLAFGQRHLNGQFTTENSNRAHGFGNLNLATFEPFPKNPAISKVFREMGLADELGSGMRNTYKYTRLYSGAEPQFVEGDIFRTIIPLSEAATATVRPTSTVTTTDTTIVTTTDKDMQAQAILDYCTEPRSVKEILAHLGLVNKQHLHKTYLKSLLTAGKLKMTLPDKPSSKNQKYVKADKNGVRIASWTKHPTRSSCGRTSRSRISGTSVPALPERSK